MALQMLRALVVSSVVHVASVEAIVPPRGNTVPSGGGDKVLEFANVFNRPLAYSTFPLTWAPTGSDDDTLTYMSDGTIALQSIVSGNVSKTLIEGSTLPRNYYDFWLNHDATKFLFAVNFVQQYRHSYFADYVVYDSETGETASLLPEMTGDIQYAAWSPTADVIAFVRGNNLYLWEGGEITQVTDDGGEDYFNAVPDWVYEEEIYGDRSVMWFSPDGEKLVFLSTNETGVGTFTVPYYIDTDDMEVTSYPDELEIRYPKVGTTNPTIWVNLLDVASGAVSAVSTDVTELEKDNLIIGEVTWLTGNHSTFAYRAYNRVQDSERVVSVSTETLTSAVIHERTVSEGWLEPKGAMTYLGPVGSKCTEYYVDLSDASGWMHIYLYPVKGGEPIALTSGDWEVMSLYGMDKKSGLIYFSSTKHHSTERHVYSVSIATQEITPLVDDEKPAYWTASFSRDKQYVVLNYYGPDVPYQELYFANDTSTPIRTITSNSALIERLGEYNLPNITFFELEHPDGYSLNVMQALPPNFDPAKKYPVLFTPYGGPNSQEVLKTFPSFAFNEYISSDPELEYVTWTVDNRGAGGKGRAFRSQVAKHLGEFEALDQVWAARELIRNNGWVDAERIGMWGWSYGGYLTAKVLELDTDVFSLGLITAPVSTWALYDTMYTERYMKTPELNPEGYAVSGVVNVDGFKNARGGFLIQHGTGDDNVHFQNAADLVHRLMSGGVSPDKMQVQWFTDSAHSISFNGARTFVYKQLARRLYEEKQREGDRGGVHQWSRRSDGGDLWPLES